MNEFNAVWENRNAPEFLLNAANLSRISPHLLYISKQLIAPINGEPSKLKILADTAIKIVTDGEHKLFRIDEDVVFNPATNLDEGYTLTGGKDYHIYLVAGLGTTADIVVSRNATCPANASMDNSRRIGGFHTVCEDIDEFVPNTHSLYGYLAGNILPQSVWDLLNRPATCQPQGMVKDPKTGIWVDIYLSSGLQTSKSMYKGIVAANASFDELQESLSAVGKRMLTDAEFTSAATGTEAYRIADNVQTNLDDVFVYMTGGNSNVGGNRIVSDIGCEDMCGYFWQAIGQQSGTDYAVAGQTTYTWEDAVPSGEGRQLLPSNIIVAGGSILTPNYAGARCRNVANSRHFRNAHIGTRGCANSLAVV